MTRHKSKKLKFQDCIILILPGLEKLEKLSLLSEVPTTPDSEMPIIEGWTRNTYNLKGRVKRIPSDTILAEILRFPKEGSSDLYNLDKFRLRESQKFSPINQVLLMAWSNMLVKILADESYLLTNSSKQTSAYHKAASEWCDKNVISYEEYNYYHDLDMYCWQILPAFSKANPDRQNEVNLASMQPDSMLQETLEKYPYFNKIYRVDESLRRRFSEYREITAAYKSIEEKMKEDELMKNIFQQREDAIFTRNRNWDAQGKDVLKDLGIENRIISQCNFCHKIHFQKSHNRVSRLCSSDACKKQFEGWKDCREKLGEPISDVSLNGF